MGRKHSVVLGKKYILLRDKFTCFYCGKSYLLFINGVTQFNIDHIHPKSVGGRDVAGNLITACKYCNAVKRDSILANELAVINEINKRNLLFGISFDTIINLNRYI